MLKRVIIGNLSISFCRGFYHVCENFSLDKSLNNLGHSAEEMSYFAFFRKSDAEKSKLMFGYFGLAKDVHFRVV